MANRLEQEYRLRLSNHHLSNIYDSGQYIEAGNIEALSIMKLINGGELSFHEIINPEIARVSPSKMTEASFDEIIQLLYFHQQKMVDTSEKIFLTCGVLKWRSSKDNEVFAPIVLIPIRLRIESCDNILLKRVGKIIGNKYLIEEIKRRMGVDIPHFDRSESILEIDHYGELVARLSNSSFELGNYITYAKVDYPDLELPREKMSPQRSYMNYGEAEIHLMPILGLNMVLPANREQKDALIVASEGKNFAIDGKLGTGKTTTAINIMANMIKNEKRVLYLSNNKNAIDQVKRTFSELGIAKYLLDLDHPKEFLFDQPIEGAISMETDPTIRFKKNIIGVTRYQALLNQRMNGYRYSEIHQQLIDLTSKPKAPISYHKKLNLQRHEVQAIVESIRKIEESLGRVEGIDRCGWRALHDNLRHTDEERILDALASFKSAQSEGRTLSDQLEREFRFTKVSDIRIVRRLIFNFNSMKMHYPVPTWIKNDLSVFREAIRDFEELRKAIKEYYTVSDEIARKYDYRMSSFDMSDIIESLYGEYFRLQDTDKVDFLLNNKKHVLRLALSVESFKNNFSKIKSGLLSAFRTKKLELGKLEDIRILYDLLTKVSLDKKWINFPIAEKTSLLKKMKNFEEFFLGHAESTAFVQSSLIKIDSEAILEVLRLSGEHPKKKGPENKPLTKKLKKILKSTVLKDPSFQIQKFVQKLKKHLDFERDLEKNLQAYKDLFGEKPEAIEGMTEQLSAFFAFIEKLKNTKDFPGKTYLSSFVQAGQTEQVAMLRALNALSMIQEEIEKLIEEFKYLGIKVRGHTFEHRVAEAGLIAAYIKKLFRTNDYIKGLLLEHKETITIEDYTYIRDIFRKKHDVLMFLEQKEPHYRRLYGSYYRGLNTEDGQIRQATDKFQNFIKMFDEEQNVIALFEEQKFPRFFAFFDEVSKFYEKWMQCFREYSKYFKENIIGFIDNSFVDNIKNIQNQLEHKAHLKDYLLVLEQCNAIEEFRLDTVKKAVFSGEVKEHIEEGFLFQYFSTLHEAFEQKRKPEEDVSTVLTKLVEIEEDVLLLLQEHARSLAGKEHFDKERMIAKLRKIPANDHNRMIMETNRFKQVVLCDSDMLLSGIDLNAFDCLIVDDAHLSNANKYNRITEARQLIILGDKDAKSSVANSLISRIRIGNSIGLKYNYHPNNKMLLDYRNEKDSVFGVINHFSSKDQAIRLVEGEESFGEWLKNAIDENKESKINVFIGNETTHFETYKAIARHLVDIGLTKEEIVRELTDRIRVIDLKTSYGEYADYNIVYYNDFMDMEEVALDILVSSVLAAKNEVLFYFRIGNGQQHSLRKSLENILEFKGRYQKFPEVKQDGSIRHHLSDALKNKGCKVFSGFGKIDLVVKKKNKALCVMIYNDSNRIDADLIGDYENYVRQYKKYEVPVVMLFSKNCCDHFDQQVKIILSAMGE